MGHKGSLHQLFLVFVSVCLWLLLLIQIFDHYPGVSHALFLAVLAVFQIATLAAGTLPVFVVLWLMGPPVEEVGKAVFRFVSSIYSWVGDPYQLIGKGGIFGEIASGFIATPVVSTVALGTLFAVAWTWPLNITLGLILIILLVANLLDTFSHLEVVVSAIRSVFPPVALAMCGVLWMQLFFNMYDFLHFGIDKSMVLVYENRLSYLSAKSKDWVDFSIPASIGLAASLLLLALLLPGLRPVTKLLSFRDAVAKASAILVCLSSFTFLSQVPSKLEDWKESRRIEAEKRVESKESEAVAVKAIYLIVRNMSPSNAAYYRRMVEELDDTVPYREHGRIIEGIVRTRMSTASPFVAAAKLTGTNDVHALLNTESNEQAIDVIKDLFCRIIGAAHPEISGLAGKFIDELIDQESERIFDQEIKPKIEVDMDEVAVKEAQQGLQWLAVKNDASKDIDLVHKEIRKELKEQEDKLRDEDYRREIKNMEERPVEEE